MNFSPKPLLLKVALLSASIFVSSACLYGGQLYRASFHGLFDNVYMPLTQMDGSYVFEYPAPPTSADDFTAFYSLQSASFALNGSLFQSQGGFLRVDNNLTLASPERLRDSYAVVAPLDGTFAEFIVLQAGGLEFDQVGSSPAAFNSLELPTSAAHLAGFDVSDFRCATLTFENLQLGLLITANAPIQDLTIVPVPEPAPLSLFALATSAAVLCGIRRRHKEKSRPSSFPLR